VLRVARRLLGTSSDADDLLHDVFLEAWQNVRAYDPQRASVLTSLMIRTRSRAAYIHSSVQVTSIDLSPSLRQP
jgi:RNA polymerase sigma-70 factor (ECF subfamily)